MERSNNNFPKTSLHLSIKITMLEANKLRPNSEQFKIELGWSTA